MVFSSHLLCEWLIMGHIQSPVNWMEYLIFFSVLMIRKRVDFGYVISDRILGSSHFTHSFWWINTRLINSDKFTKSYVLQGWLSRLSNRFRNIKKINVTNRLAPMPTLETSKSVQDLSLKNNSSPTVVSLMFFLIGISKATVLIETSG